MGALPRISAFDAQAKLSKTKPTVAGLTALIDAPPFDDIDPAANEILVFSGNEVPKAPAHDPRRG